MSDTVIRVENLGKKYIIGHQQQERYTALRDVITNKVKSLANVINPKFKNQNSQEEFWSLKDVSFEIKQGDRVGIIGRNGAGKSTLLKILSRITEPTQGSIKIKGRIASLLEVGTGFHPELTGRENIFLNGAILGMGKLEIQRKFDEIVAFAEIEKFLDTPVKRYSSGMYVRLAFAVAAHLEPEILIVDEVLAVGDAVFQKKCLGKMEDVGKEGRTVLFVSHNMATINKLCSKAILLVNGSLFYEGDTLNCIQKYLKLSNSNEQVQSLHEKRNNSPYPLTLNAKIENIKIISNNNVNPSILESEKPVLIETKILCTKTILCSFYISITRDEQEVIWLCSGPISGKTYILKSGINTIACQIHKLNLAIGDYKMNIGLSVPNQEWIDFIDNAYAFSIETFDPKMSGFNMKYGVFYVEHDWITQENLIVIN
ncbi:ABC transporter ATP-binding protein [Calothrix sp. FACHB-1219]|uniref:ABC transporter ATP-binding protein n=1 Tax=unclassified Calothrix TaxID=2619626 RepID=UPI0016850BD5|nr:MULTISPECIES: ABC transporter ATP-binding protein [unclassified Calothrix]MBD2201187.1 ABC transporter ATP-binding protein [Calothrix sp. FACHB-168]MBD2215621.1 ABC transporter ATP-binding protein [Calothrix sp. FACHB-1219]